MSHKKDMISDPNSQSRTAPLKRMLYHRFELVSTRAGSLPLRSRQVEDSRWVRWHGFAWIWLWKRGCTPSWNGWGQRLARKRTAANFASRGSFSLPVHVVGMVGASAPLYLWAKDRSPSGPSFAHRQNEIRALARTSDFRRQAVGLKLVSERPVSLWTLTSPKSRRIQKCDLFQVFAENGLRLSWGGFDRYRCEQRHPKAA